MKESTTLTPGSLRERTFLTGKEAARYLGLSHRTLEDWRLTGKGPPFRRFGRAVRYGMRDLEAFAAECAMLNTAGARAAAA